MFHTHDILRDAAFWGAVSLFIFLAVFIGTTVWVATRSRGDVSHWSSLPLDGASSSSASQSQEERV